MPEKESPLDHSAVSTRQYRPIFKKIENLISVSRIKAATSVNMEMIQLYWQIGNVILKQQKLHGWGSKIVLKLSNDLRNSFNGLKGFSTRNLEFMLQFASAYPDFGAVEQFVSRIPWGHNIVLLQKLATNEERIWYAKKTIEHGWSRSMLTSWVESKLFYREGQATTNFKHSLAPPRSDLATQTMKDPYIFDFVELRDKHDEKELEDGLIAHIQRFLLELGTGFAFIGRQYPIQVGDKDYYIDLLFYHLSLKCYCVIELKAQDFKPEFTGKMNFYLSAIDDLLRKKDDNPTIGMILCKNKDNYTAEYALRDINKPIGIAEYETKILESLPNNLKGSLPSIEEIEEELSNRKDG